jgi:two-component system NtrC family sensor kinase
MPFDALLHQLFPVHLIRNPYYRSLIRNMVLIILTVSMIPMVLVSSTLYLQFRDSYRGKVNDHLRELVQKHKQNIDTFLQERLTDIRLMAARYGHERLKDTATLQLNLDLLQQEYGVVFSDLGVVSARGYQEAYAGPFKLGQAYYGESAWFKEALKRDQVISDVFLGLRGLPHFIVAVHNTAAGTPWILRATIDFAYFNNLVDNVRIGRTGQAFILNREGRLQTSAGPHRPLTASLDEPYLKGLWETMASGREEVRIRIMKDHTGHEHICAGAFLKNGDWLLVYQQSAGDAFADLDQSFLVATVLMMLGAAAVVIMAVALSRRMVTRIANVDTEKKIMNEQVVETGKLASIGELAAGVAHEINNPVAIMVEEAGWIEDLLLEEDLQSPRTVEEFKRSLGQIKTQGRRCKEITQKLLSFARKSSAQIQDIRVNELLSDLLAISAQRARYGKVELTTRFADHLPSVRVSISELQQVFLNLINNALDAMENNGGTLTLSTRAEGGFVVVDFADTGVGIPAPYLNRIFDPFFTTKAVGKGTGLGLSICYGIIHKMGGKIEVKSTVDIGSTFTVYIPSVETNGSAAAVGTTRANGTKGDE